MKRYAPSGKFFTDVISKHPLRAMIQTIDGQIDGLVHLHPITVSAMRLIKRTPSWR